MGTFAGHLLPGVFFITFSIWWTINILKYHFKSQFVTKGKNPNDFDYGVNFSLAQNKLIQGLLITLATSIGFVGEYLTSHDKGNVMCKDNLQHMSMYSAFFLCGLAYLLLHFGVPLPSDIQYLMFLMAYFNEGLLFYFHLHGRNILDVHVHTLMVVAVGCTVVATAFEWAYKDNILAALGRPFGTFIQGTWIIHIGFILYNPLPGHTPWKSDDHENLMVVTTLFCWHISSAVVIFTYLYVKYNRVYESLTTSNAKVFVQSCYTDYNRCEYKPLANNTRDDPTDSP